MSDVFLYITVFLTGGIGYGALEILWRGYTHPSMLAAGGICFTLLHIINTKTDFTRLQKAISGAAVITTVEFIFGCIFNIELGLGVWDYSAMPYNLCGQICAGFTLLWAVLAYFSEYLSAFIEKRLKK